METMIAYRYVSVYGTLRGNFLIQLKRNTMNICRVFHPDSISSIDINIWTPNESPYSFQNIFELRSFLELKAKSEVWLCLPTRYETLPTSLSSKAINVILCLLLEYCGGAWDCRRINKRRLIITTWVRREPFLLTLYQWYLPGTL